MSDSKKQYPPQTGAYAVKVKNGRKWNAYSTARFHISVGQSYHESEKFQATMQWAKHRFDHVIICVNDTLQRYNYTYKESISDVDAMLKAENAGREWIERNLHTIRSLPSHEIIRWNNWLNHQDFPSQNQFVQDLYLSDENVRSLIAADVMNFWKRRNVREGAETYSDFEKFRAASTAYLLEETAAFFLMFKRDVAVDIYPGSVLLPCVLAEKYLGISNRDLGNGSFTRIDFSRRDTALIKQA